MYIHSKGSPSAPVWCLVDRPLSDDDQKGYLYSAPLGWVFDKMMQDAGISDYYVTSYRPDTVHADSWKNMEGEINQYKPPIIIPLGAIGGKLIPALVPKRKGKTYNEDKDSELSKYCGSLLNSPYITYPHYVVPTFEPGDVVKQWKMRDVVINCDLMKAKAELDYWNTNAHTIQPLPQRLHKVDFGCFEELLSDIDSMANSEYVSCDIETIYPRAPTKTQKSQFYKILPGYPICIGLATSETAGISFDFFRENLSETRELWKHLYKLLENTPQIGQNYFNFDAVFLRSMGFKLPLDKCRDTMIMHHVIWPELPHKLQFLARQYTREPYWKDEGAGWSPNNMRGMKIYNVKDVCVTYEIFQKESLELRERGLE